MTVFDEARLKDKPGVFEDRFDAGAKLAQLVKRHEGRTDLVLAIPAGGVPVAVALARVLEIPVDAAVVSKPTLPWTTEAGFGAVAFDGTTRFNAPLVRRTGLTEREIAEAVAEAQSKVNRRVESFHRRVAFPEIAKKSVMVIDDGLASGFTMQVAVEAIGHFNPARVTVAVPTAHAASLKALEPRVDEVFCCNIRHGNRFAVADAYLHWCDVGEAEAIRLIEESRTR
jgi:predicted phosphoribosyltransferase